ncbi:sulfurtransferase [Pedobacter changchengzhani]|uniref:Sulfurtransferase n=1 Tax=Pedobacter changchengzhani TaxID=2529274 RepID=A0A4R5MN45_9SPHI|nr:sulfurtransferase [Pedobacter changchengzhani]
MSPLIQADELLALYKSKNVIIVDVSNGISSKANYQRKHLDTAIFVDLNSQLADVKDDLSNGGRHPLPKIEDFAETLKNIGITAQGHVVIYDDKDGANAAARFWWMLKSIGHEDVQVLNGGFQQAEKIGFPVNDKVEIPKISGTYKHRGWILPIVEMKEVEQNALKENYTVIDVRENNRYCGRNEPLDLIAGHIPGSINIPFSTNLDEDGLFLTPEKLHMKYEAIINKNSFENVIIHCGSGVTACHTLLAIDYAGLEIPKLYVGSWSEWSRNNKNFATEI